RRLEALAHRRRALAVRVRVEARLARREDRQELLHALDAEPRDLDEPFGARVLRRSVRTQRAALALGRPQAHDAVAANDVLADLRADPVRRVRGEPALLREVELLRRAQKAEVA